jgi:two-component system, NtrC family, sensor kinase
VLIGNLYSFEQVILILLSNARDAVTEKSLTADGDFQKKIYIHTQLREKRIVVQIGDNGAGIPEENLQKIFKPFFTTKEMGKGTGLGLAIARGIIREMAGEISVNSVAGKGTIINLFFNLTGAE